LIKGATGSRTARTVVKTEGRIVSIEEMIGLRPDWIDAEIGKKIVSIERVIRLKSARIVAATGSRSGRTAGVVTVTTVRGRVAMAQIAVDAEADNYK
jgi:hypothetical protein